MKQNRYQSKYTLTVNHCACNKNKEKCFNVSTKTSLANALNMKGASTKKLLDLLQKGVINT